MGQAKRGGVGGGGGGGGVGGGGEAPWGPIDGWGAVQTGACILRTPPPGAGAGQRQKYT